MDELPHLYIDYKYGSLYVEALHLEQVVMYFNMMRKMYFTNTLK